MGRIDLQGVPETMLQTLYARAAHSKRADHKFYDAKAIEIVEQLDYDFSKAGKDKAMSARRHRPDDPIGPNGEAVCEGKSKWHGGQHRLRPGYPLLPGG